MPARELPDADCTVRAVFGIDTDIRVPCFSAPREHVPTRDESFRFDRQTTLAILAGFAHDRRVLIQGFHGTGKTSHIEQVAARLNWPCLRINLDSQVSRLDLVGKDAIVLSEGRQITEFHPGILTWALQHPAALVFDEYDAGRPDVMFVIHRVLENEGKLTLLDQARVITPHPAFRLFATANTIGLGDASGLYPGTHPLNQGQLDRWHIVSTLNYLPPEQEIAMVLSRVPRYDNPEGRRQVASMVALAGLTRIACSHGELSCVMSPRTVIHWAQNTLIFADVGTALRLTFINKCDTAEQPLVAEYFQRCFDLELA
jgi:cobaltochelatase CobS